MPPIHQRKRGMGRGRATGMEGWGRFGRVVAMESAMGSQRSKIQDPRSREDPRNKIQAEDQQSPLGIARISILPPRAGARTFLSTFLSAATLEVRAAYALMKSQDDRKLLRTGMSALRRQYQDAPLEIWILDLLWMLDVERWMLRNSYGRYDRRWN